jgi:hypothetical protein
VSSHMSKGGGLTDSDVELAEELIAVLRVTLKVIAREEAVGREGKAYVRRLGDVERGQDQLGEACISGLCMQRCLMGSSRPYLVFLSLQANVIAELEHAGEGIVENSDAFFAQREAQNHCSLRL